MPEAAVHWFRKGLRLHDNPALLAAARHAAASGGALYPVFVLDPWFLQPSRVGANRVQFLLQCLGDLHAGLQRHNSRLLVLRGKPEVELLAFMQQHEVSLLTFEQDDEPYARRRDGAIRREVEVEPLRVRVEQHCSHTLWDPAQLLAQNKGEPPKSYTTMQKMCAAAGPPRKPLPPPAVGELPALPPALRAGSDKADAQFGIPTLAELGYDPADAQAVIAGGETEGLARLGAFLADATRTATFEKPKTKPTDFNPPSTTALSPHLKFGALSARTFYHRVQAVVEKHKGSKSAPPVSLEGQILWREHWYLIACHTKGGPFDAMVTNPICRQIDWDTNLEHLEAWKNAKTGFPWIDAAMTQLRTEGWMHHLARHAVACFLTRGDLYLSWEEGAKVFDVWLLDSDWSLNNCNWMWLSASAFFHTFFRVYSPVAFGQKSDKEGDYIRHYLPVLAKMPKTYIYEPWKAPLAVQKAAGCVIGVDYPKPIVDHATVSKANMGRMKAAYDRKQYGAPATAGGGAAGDHPLPPALRQVGCASGEEFPSGGGAEGGPSAPKKRRT